MLFFSYFSKTIATTETTKLRQASKQFSKSKVRDGGNLGKEKSLMRWTEKLGKVDSRLVVSDTLVF